MVKTRSGNKYGEKPFVPLRRLHDVVPKIITKMPNLELARMRRTCSAMNSMVEKRTEILSRRTMKAENEKETLRKEKDVEPRTESLINIKIRIKKEGENEICLAVNGKEQRIEGDLKAKLGPFTINQLLVRNDDNISPAKYEEFLQWIRQMRFNCAKLILEELPVQLTFDMLDSMELEEAELRFEKRLSTQDLQLLSSSRHVSVLKLVADKADLHKTQVEVFKKFKKLKIMCYRAQALENIIMDINSTKDAGNLENIMCWSIFLYDTDDMLEIEVPFPQLWIGWKPEAIYWKVLKRKQMVLIHYGPDPHPYRGRFEFFFFEKGADALTDFFMKNVLIKKDFKEDFQVQFTKANFKKKCELLKEAIHQPNGGMCARKSAPAHIPRHYSSDTDTEGSSSESEFGSEFGSESDSD